MGALVGPREPRRALAPPPTVGGHPVIGEPRPDRIGELPRLLYPDRGEGERAVKGKAARRCSFGKYHAVSSVPMRKKA